MKSSRRHFLRTAIGGLSTMAWPRKSYTAEHVYHSSAEEGCIAGLAQFVEHAGSSCCGADGSLQVGDVL